MPDGWLLPIPGWRADWGRWQPHRMPMWTGWCKGLP